MASSDTEPAPTVATTLTATTTDASTSSDAALIDSTIDHSIAGANILTTLSGSSMNDLAGQYDLAASEFLTAADNLGESVDGVPPTLVVSVRDNFQRLGNGVKTLGDCLRTATSDIDCDAISKIVEPYATALGEDMASLIPYGTRTKAEAFAALK